MDALLTSRPRLVIFIFLLLLINLAHATSLPSTPSTSPSSTPSTSSIFAPSTTPTQSPTSSPEITRSPTIPTRSPTPPSTWRPTRQPTTASPASPTAFAAPTTAYPTPPTTYHPTTSPTLSSPSATPTSSLPTAVPSAAPTPKRPTTSPTVSRPSLAPTKTKPSGSPSHAPTRSPVLPRYCSNLYSTASTAEVYGTVCTELVGGIDFNLEFAVRDGFRVNTSSVWMGMDPTVIPTLADGELAINRFPIRNQQIASMQLGYVEYTENCEVYVLAQAQLSSNSSDELSMAMVVSGTVPFHRGAVMFIHPVPCPMRTLQPTKLPTVHPTAMPTLLPTKSPTEVFNVRFHYVGLPPQRALVQALHDAVSWLQTLLPKDYASSMCIPAGETHCAVRFESQVCFDDMLLVVDVVPALQQSQVQPCIVGDTTQQVRAGYIKVQDASNDSPLYTKDYMLHLLLQSLGFGTRWEVWGLINAGGYRGRAAKEQYALLGGKTNEVPTATTELGTTLWSPVALGSREIMTPWSSYAQPPKQLSTITIASLLDLNFLAVDLSKASPSYALPSNAESAAGRRRQLQETTSSISELPTIVKPERQADFDLELKFAQQNFPAFQPAGLSDGAIAGIVIGVLVGVCLLCLLFYCLCCRRKSGNKKQQPAANKREPESKWVEKTDGERTYWINEETGEFSWTPPAGVGGITTAASAAADTAARLPPPSVAAAVNKRSKSAAQSEWTEMMDESGNAFWVNDETGEFSWVPPTGAEGASRPLVGRTLTTSNNPYDDDESTIFLVSKHRYEAPRTSRSDSTPAAPPPPPPSARRRSSEMQLAPAHNYYDDEEEDYEAYGSPPQPQTRMGEHRGAPVWREDFDML